MFVFLGYALIYILSSFAIIQAEERTGCFAFIVLRMSCYRECYVALPPGVVGWSALCDCVFSDHTQLLFAKHNFGWSRSFSENARNIYFDQNLLTETFF